MRAILGVRVADLLTVAAAQLLEGILVGWGRLTLGPDYNADIVANGPMVVVVCPRAAPRPDRLVAGLGVLGLLVLLPHQVLSGLASAQPLAEPLIQEANRRGQANSEQ